MFEAARGRLIEQIEIPDTFEYEEQERGSSTYSEYEKAIYENAEKYGLQVPRRGYASMSEAGVFTSYTRDMNLKVADLVGKDILDVGGGGGQFSRAIEKIGVSKSITNLDPSEWLTRKAGDKLVRGVAEALPFKDESFDLVLAHASVPIVQADIGKFDLIPHTIREMIRVSKRGGIIKISSIGARDKEPQHGKEYKMNMKVMRIVLDELKAVNIKNPTLKIKITKIRARDLLPSQYLLEVRK